MHVCLFLQIPKCLGSNISFVYTGFMFEKFEHSHSEHLGQS